MAQEQSQGTLRVAPETLRTKAAEFEAEGTDFVKYTNNMLNTIQEMTGSAWTGAAAQAYVSKFQDFSDICVKVSEEIKDYTEKLQKIADQYSNAEEQNIEVSSSLNAKIGELV